MSTDQHPLTGIRVLDMTQIYNGPYCTFLMAMAGADVIKVEPPGGEHLRRRNARGGALYPFKMLNPNKRSITLDLKNSDERAIFLELAETVDVVIENYAPGVVDRLGVGHAAVKKVNPNIIYASGSGYGQDGPYAGYQAMDIAVQAMGGVMSQTGFPENPPVKAGVALCDFFAGIHLYGGVMTALVKRGRTGEGSFVDVSMQEAVFPAFASNLGLMFDSDGVPSRTGNFHGGLSIAPYGVFPAKDGYTSIICNNDIHWDRLLDAIGRADLKDDPRYVTMAARVQNLKAVTELISEWSATLDRADIMECLNKARVPCGSVKDLNEVVEDENLHARGMIRWITDSEGHRSLAAASPLHIDGVNQVDYQLPPEVDADREEILAELKERRGR
ncbi:MAG: CoA transferase [Alphaproteobacteria bacterium]|nr:CoA transferase [Alphaproteobacteria bacterium]